ncbi:hypothetical protein L1987_01517 [Smallanthus sonchifolius]|uniref:Uncharacterized protein n=1 Tax=Smallanthus sonchifolius TaxID=185202 RepID=A0ACB9K5C0_9ASTR|nr:hypothetical protein L1987_01517 [Smallanthus sonchifolius]
MKLQIESNHLEIMGECFNKISCYTIKCFERTKSSWTGLEHYNEPITFVAFLYAYERGKTICTTLPALQLHNFRLI